MQMSEHERSDRVKLNALIWVAYHLEAASIVERYVAKAVEELKCRGHKAVVCRDLESVLASVPDADIMLCWRILPEVFAKASRLRWIQFGSAGIDHTLFPELIQSDVILTTLSGIHRTPVAEHVMALMLAMSHRLDIAIKQQCERVYDRLPISTEADELCGKTVGILGLGKIGEEIARLCSAFGMRVIGTKQNIEKPIQYVEKVFSPSEMDIVLAESDYIVLVLPLTHRSVGLIGRREIEMMKTGARIVNVARGAMIDTAALIDALNSGRIAGAALDVFDVEPLPADSPLYDAPNVIITPHVAGANPKYAERAFEIFRANLHAFESGGSMINVFDRSRGY
jgi:phosphoglycerate dehydrogenase-like enzyme